MESLFFGCDLLAEGKLRVGACFLWFLCLFSRREKIMIMKGYMNRLVWMALVLGIVAELEEDEV